MSTYEIWHNPRCSKSRQTLARLRDVGIEPEIVEYLQTPPDAGRIADVVAMLGLATPRALMRLKEPAYEELGLADVDDADELIAAMVANPTLIERPVVIRDGKRAVLGRPPDNVDRLL